MKGFSHQTKLLIATQVGASACKLFAYLGIFKVYKLSLENDK